MTLENVLLSFGFIGICSIISLIYEKFTSNLTKTKVTGPIIKRFKERLYRNKFICVKGRSLKSSSLSRDYNTKFLEARK